MDGLEWVEVGEVNVNAATVGFIDADLTELIVSIGEAPTWVFGRPEPSDDGQYVVFSTQEDGIYPVEVALDLEGVVIAIRVELVDDVADIEGTWDDLGTLRLRSPAVVVADPYCLRPGLPGCVRVELPAGAYRVQRYQCEGEWLGLRMLAG